MYYKWMQFVPDVLESMTVNNNSYEFRWLPNGGGIYDQDDEIIDIWMLIKSCYIEVMNDAGFITMLNKKREKQWQQ